MSFTLAGINDRLLNFVDEQVNCILHQLIIFDDTCAKTRKIRSHDLSESIIGSPEIKALVQNIEKQLARNIFDVEDNKHLLGDFGLNGYSVQNKLKRLPCINETAVSEISGAFNSLPHDIINSRSWPDTCVILRNCLFCNNYSIFLLSLHIHAKLTHSLTSSAIKEAFKNLCSGLQLYYKKNYADIIINFDSGIDTQNPIHCFMVKICHLIIETVKHLPKNWVRYGKRNVESVCECFLNLLVFHMFTPQILLNVTKNGESVYPFHIISTLDPLAEWCVCWLHSSFGQNMLFATHFSCAKTLVCICVDTMIVHLDEKQCTCNTILLATVIHSANVLTAMLRYRESQKFFPIVFSSRFGDHQVSVYDFGLSLARYVMKCSPGEDLKQQSVANSVSNLLLSLIESGACKLADEEIMSLIVEPLSAPYLEGHPRAVQNAVVFLKCFAKTARGSKALWGLGEKPELSKCRAKTSRSASGPRKSSLSGSRQQSTKSLRVPVEGAVSTCPACRIVHFTAYVLERHCCQEVVVPLVDVCGSLLELHEGVLHYREIECDLLNVAAATYGQQSSCDTTATADSLLELFVRVSSTPGGISLLLKEGTATVLGDTLRACMSRWQEPSARLLAVLAPHHQLATERVQLVSTALCRLQLVHQHPELLAGLDRRFIVTLHHFTNILHTLACTLQGVASLLSDGDGSSGGTTVDSDGPSSLLELLTSDSLPEEWHYIALLVLQLLVADLNVLLYLNHRLNFPARLLQLQRESTAGQQCAAVIVDRCSVVRHQLLVTAHVVGGPSEVNYGCPMFTSYPQPHALYCRPQPCSRTRTHLHKFLKDTEVGLHDVGWVVNARKAYRSSAYSDMKPAVVLGIVEQLARCCNISAAREVDWSVMKPGELFPEDELGIQLAVRYGLYCGVLQPAAQNTGSLAVLVRIGHGYTGAPQTFTGFPWFLATAFNLCGGALDRCYSFLSDAWSLPATEYLQLKSELSKHDMMFGHILEYIIASELPLAFNALQMSGLSWWLVCRQWMGQCFWNVLDWSQICHWLVVSFLYPQDYMVYFCAALLRHAQLPLVTACAQERVVDSIKLQPLSGFKIHEHLSFMEQLAKCYRTSVLPLLQDL